MSMQQAAASLDPFAFGTKAETLDRLRPRLATGAVPELVWFTVATWRAARAATLATIADRLRGAVVAVRSSACAEDGAAASLAGACRSRLDVAPHERAAAIDDVAASLAARGGRPDDHVLVQRMVRDVAVAGVAASRVVDDGAPYRVVSYDDRSGRPDRVTGGSGVSKTVWVAHAATPAMVDSPRLRRWLALLRDVERCCGGVPLEIEFVEDRAGELWLLQARRITTTRHWGAARDARVSAALADAAGRVASLSRRRRGLAGTRTILGEMPDWNPAEIIGSTPAALARSLYGRLVTDRVWRDARARMGYRPVPAQPLVVDVGGRAYVDVRLSCNSFLPAGTSPSTAELLVDAWLERLATAPELHDALEFAIVPTALDLDFDATFRSRYGDLLGPRLPTYRAALRAVTARCLSGDTLAWARAAVARLAARQRRAARPTGLDGSAFRRRLAAALAECERLGTLPFAVAARHAFVAEALLRSAVTRGALAPERAADLKASLSLPTGALVEDMRAVAAGGLALQAFHARWGYVRPGTYDIRSRRYDARPELFAEATIESTSEPVPPVEPDAAERAALDRLLGEAGLPGDATRLFAYARDAIALREWAKLVFSRSVSDALEAIAAFGARYDVGRDDLAHVSLAALVAAAGGPASAVGPRLRDDAAAGRAALEHARTLRLSYLLRDANDVYVAPLHRSAPSFVGRGRVEAPVVRLDADGGRAPLAGAVVCIAQADPGFDWIFARGIAGLVTQYGGSNSHMAIRCAELRLPAALGCGALAFERLASAAAIELDCDAGLVRALPGVRVCRP
jgi:hypothetical protein